MGWLMTVYIATAIFGLGVTIIDMLGILGEGQADQDSHLIEEADVIDMDHDAPDFNEGDRASNAGLDQKQGVHFLMRLLTLLRMLVYFCLGFGPVGLMALLTGSARRTSLLYSLPVGLFTLLAALFLRRLQGKQLDSQIKEQDLIMARAKVIVSIRKGQLGKVRIHLGDTSIDRFARANNVDQSFQVGEEVIVENISADAVYVSSVDLYK